VAAYRKTLDANADIELTPTVYAYRVPRGE
jgi:hypothetical protein